MKMNFDYLIAKAYGIVEALIIDFTINTPNMRFFIEELYSEIPADISKIKKAVINLHDQGILMLDEYESVLTDLAKDLFNLKN